MCDRLDGDHALRFGFLALIEALHLRIEENGVRLCYPDIFSPGGQLPWRWADGLMLSIYDTTALHHETGHEVSVRPFQQLSPCRFLVTVYVNDVRYLDI